jgi:Arc/MetJ-type ribon-helix-helix transcriptional regulator
MMDEVELIEIRLPTLNKTVQLSREASAHIWDAVKRGEANSAEEYVNQALDRWLIANQAADTPGSEKGQGTSENGNAKPG